MRSLNLTKLKDGFIPSFTKTEITNDLKNMFNIKLDAEITTSGTMKKIINLRKGVVIREKLFYNIKVVCLCDEVVSC